MGRVDLLLAREDRWVVVECKRAIRGNRDLRMALAQTASYKPWFRDEKAEGWLIADTSVWSEAPIAQTMYGVRFGTPKHFIDWTGPELGPPPPPPGPVLVAHDVTLNTWRNRDRVAELFAEFGVTVLDYDGRHTWVVGPDVPDRLGDALSWLDGTLQEVWA